MLNVIRTSCEPMLDVDRRNMTKELVGENRYWTKVSSIMWDEHRPVVTRFARIMFSCTRPEMNPVSAASTNPCVARGWYQGIGRTLVQ